MQVLCTSCQASTTTSFSDFQLAHARASLRLFFLFGVVDLGIHFTGDVNKIVKYNDKIIFFSLYILYCYYNIVNTIKN
jgi:hypothetical protein